MYDGGIHTTEYSKQIAYRDGIRLFDRIENDKHPTLRPSRLIITDQYKLLYARYRNGWNGLSFTIYVPTKRPKWIKRYLTDSDHITVGRNEFVVDDNGVSIPGGARCCSISFIANLIVLSGICDFVTPATEGCMMGAIQKINRELGVLDQVFGTYDDYNVRRVDYCVNLDFREMGLCDTNDIHGGLGVTTPNDYIVLLRRGRIPYPFHGDERWLANGNGLYLVNGSTHINIYWKAKQLKENNPDGYTDSSEWILRFEIQCLYRKTYQLKKDLGSSDALFSDGVGLPMIIGYLKKICGAGDWYSMSEAKKLIRSKRYQSEKVKRLIWAMDIVSRASSVEAVRSRMSGRQQERFDRCIRDLELIGINIVTIPAARGLKHVVNPVNILLKNG